GGDANADGVRSASEDEFVEIINTSDSPLDISGYTLSDSLEVRFVFPQGTLIQAHGTALIFGGGNPPAGLWPSAVLVFTTPGGLGLNNSGDSIYISDPQGTPVTSMSYTDGQASDRSLVRSQDGDPEASFIPHPGSPQSPGFAQDGTEL
ncbi:lamin tail domain-containing protein, partial [Myxococcota bacterium]|nr:lamin tail domain-containing protein [Myxococcota bacterium]